MDDDGRTPGDLHRRTAFAIGFPAPLDLFELTRGLFLYVAVRNTQARCQISIDKSCRAVTVGNRTERELGLPGHPDLAHQHDIESCVERACDLEADRDTAARQYQDDRLPVFQMQQLVSKLATGLAAICELHVRPPPSKPRAWPSDSLPQTSLFVQAIQFDTAEIETRNDSHDFVPIDDWDMSIAPVVHQ